MKWTIFCRLSRIICGALLASLISFSSWAILIPTGVDNVLLEVDNQGTLVAARNISVNGLLYDVEFDDRSFTDIFGDATGLDAISDVEAFDFSVALLDFVLIDLNNFLFDSLPLTTLGCENADICQVMTPFDVSQTEVSVARAVNVASINGDSVTLGNTTPLAPGLGRPRPLPPVDPPTELAVYANWSLSNVAIDVPEPPPWTILLAMVLIFARRRLNHPRQTTS
ncbi:hypothetical protein [Aliiglaciecola sp. M165]|uniref:hypothetical protein n=1 Tax=Aliiglaciecola sp. M165 TaxID=2593649 RepID=UPI0011815289|nr:hypothetical protein [Aliiglaciecola sp. M165]TRY33922.1 hypothetical protein FM019_01285 [Aliiglaciecola sp. M165]